MRKFFVGFSFFQKFLLLSLSLSLYSPLCYPFWIWGICEIDLGGIQFFLFGMAKLAVYYLPQDICSLSSFCGIYLTLCITHHTLGLSFRNRVGLFKIAILFCNGSVPVLLLGRTWKNQEADIKIGVHS